MPIQALIYLPNVGKSVSRVREFRRCPEHGNLLAYNGRALDKDEFNSLAPLVLGNSSMYGMQPMVKLVGEDSPPAVPLEAAKVFPVEQEDATKPGDEPPVPVPGGVVIEPLNDGFVVVDLRGESALYRGLGEGWESEIGLVAPFASIKGAANAVPDATKPASVEPETAPLVEAAPVTVETPPQTAAAAVPAPKGKPKGKVKVIQVAPPKDD